MGRPRLALVTAISIVALCIVLAKMLPFATTTSRIHPPLTLDFSQSRNVSIVGKDVHWGDDVKVFDAVERLDLILGSGSRLQFETCRVVLARKGDRVKSIRVLLPNKTPREASARLVSLMRSLRVEPQQDKLDAWVARAEELKLPALRSGHRFEQPSDSRRYWFSLWCTGHWRDGEEAEWGQSVTVMLD